MTIYASWDYRTDRYLRDDNDDTYVRPLISVMEDDPHDIDNHQGCHICHDNWGGSRWVPDNGGAWVYSSSWQESKGDRERYLKIVGHYDILDELGQFDE